jgi:transketolase N-terminal domain/subunit
MLDFTHMWEVLASTILAGFSTAGYAYKRLVNRLDNTEIEITKNKIQLEKKTDAHQVKEIINDKVAAIHIIVENIQEDVKEIKSELKQRHRK